MKHLSLFALGLGLLTVACSSDDNIDTIANYSPVGTTSFSSVPAQSSAPRMSELGRSVKTALKEHTIGGSLDFKWSESDKTKIWVEQSTGVWKPSTGATFFSDMSSGSFTFSGTYSAASYPLLYNGNPASTTSPTQVVIPAAQTQTAPNNFDHAGASGDAGYATANKNTSGEGYSFTLEHAPTFLAFWPWTQDTKLTPYNPKLTSITVTDADNGALAGTFALGASGLSGGSDTKSSVTLDVSSSGGFSIDGTADEAYYAVINPGVHRLYVDYTFQSADATKTWTHRKIVDTSTDATTNTYAPGTVYDIRSSVKAIPEGLDKYWQWGALAYYWSDFGSTKVVYPSALTSSGYTSGGSGNPISLSTVDTHNREATGDPRNWSKYPYTAGTRVKSTLLPFSKCPTTKQLAWICIAVNEGLVKMYWDATTVWSHLGRTYTGGLWIPKMATLNAAFQSASYTNTNVKTAASTAYAANFDTTNPGNTAVAFPIHEGKYTAGIPTNTDDYQFLPAYGYAQGCNVNKIGEEGFYWQSETWESSQNSVFIMRFDQYAVTLLNNGYGRGYGCTVWEWK